MKKTLSLWSLIITSPSKGFASLNEKSPFALALIIVLVLAIACSAVLIPILGSDAYTGALTRVQIETLKDRGMEMSDEQIEAMTAQLKSGRMRTITIASSTAGAAIGYSVMLIVSVLLMKIVLLISREKIAFKLLLRIMVFLAIFTVAQMLVKNLITVLTDYERVLSRVQTTTDLQWALSSPVSLAALFSPQKLNPSVYYLVDAFTDIFNWLYYGYLYAALKWSLGLKNRKALTITIIAAVLMIGIGFVITLLI